MVPRARTLRPPEADRETRQEALRILYRLRADCTKNDTTPPHVLQAIESLIEDYERDA